MKPRHSPRRRLGQAVTTILSAGAVLLGAVLLAPSQASFVDSTGAVGTIESGQWFSWVALVGGEQHTCAANADGSAWCWGINDDGELGQAGDSGDSAVPKRVKGPGGAGFLTDVVSVGAGRNHSCAVKNDGTAWCWGKNDRGQLGAGTGSGNSRSSPVQVVGPGRIGTLSGARMTTTALESSCVLRTDGTVWCWGRNDQGQLGDGTTTQRPWPVRSLLPVGEAIVDLAMGDEHACAVQADGDLYCWGRSQHGRLGNNSFSDGKVSTPIQVVGPGGAGHLTGVVEVAGGGEHTCARKIDGTVWCFGRNDRSQLGAVSADTGAPVQVQGAGGTGNLTGITSIATGNKHSCANDGTGTRCWGLNDRGQLGDNTTTDRAFPTPVLGAGAVGTLAGGGLIDGGHGEHTCMILDQFAMWCWGRNDRGQLGDGTTADRWHPVPVSGF